jgi:flagellar motility protein MotE (MotC chaperone)
MGKFLLGIATVLIVIGVAVGCLWLGDLVGILELKQLILNETGRLTGIKNLAETYELGKKQSAVLEKKEFELAKKERQLIARETKLQTEFTELQDQKQSWIKERSKTAPVQPPKGKITPRPDATPDPTLKTYLATIGAMKAEKAAAVMQNLPDETVFLILDQLRKQQAAKLMENLPPEYLTRITKARLKLRK